MIWISVEEKWRTFLFHCIFTLDLILFHSLQYGDIYFIYFSVVTSLCLVETLQGSRPYDILIKNTAALFSAYIMHFGGVFVSALVELKGYL